MTFTNEKGLTTLQAKDLQKQYGFNEIEEKTDSGLVRFIKKFLGPIPLMIEIALVLSVIAGKWEDFVIIFVLLLVNILVDFFQEQKALKALEALKKNLAPTALVLRDGVLSTIDARNLVPGDVVKLDIGEIVPADVIILDDSYLSVDQSAITGESLPVDKKKNDLVFISSVVQKGVAFAKIKSTGSKSSMGQNAKLVMKAGGEKESHFQKAILNIGKFLIALSSILIIVSFIILMLRGDGFIESTRFALILAVASVPVALPAVLSVTMVIGARALAKKKAIVANFRSIEELAGIDQLCVDKTGTLTKNKISVLNPKTYGEFTISELFTYALLAIEEEHANPIEKAIYDYAKENNILKEKEKFKTVSFQPFDPATKMTKVLVETSNTKITIAMGATQIIIKMLEEETDLKNINLDIKNLAEKGLRTIAIAISGKNCFELVGIIPLLDQPRDDSKSLIASIKEKGIKIKMLTGDHIGIAGYIANILNIGSRIIDSSTLHNTKEKIDEDKDYEEIIKTDVFAQVIPEDKYRIVSVLQKFGHIVAMTGDGVNDAPALKKSDVGIAVSGATPAARAAADIVLLDSGLSVIKDAIFNARMIFSRMQSYATFRIAETIRIVFFITLSLLFFNYSPLTAIMIILLALLNDIPVMSIAYDNAPIQKDPVRWHMRETLLISFILGIAGLISSFLLFYLLNVNGFAIATIQTILFLKLDVAGHSTLYITRTGKKHFWERPFPSLKFFIPAFSSRIIGTLLAGFGIFMVSISWRAVVIIWIYSLIWFFFNDQVKVISYKIIDRYYSRYFNNPSSHKNK